MKREELELNRKVKEARGIVSSRVWKRQNFVERILLIKRNWRRFWI
jgi:hypothetical protein